MVAVKAFCLLGGEPGSPIWAAKNAQKPGSAQRCSFASESLPIGRNHFAAGTGQQRPQGGRLDLLVEHLDRAVAVTDRVARVVDQPQAGVGC